MLALGRPLLEFLNERRNSMKSGVLLFASAVFFAAGCTTPKTLYHWGEYPQAVNHHFRGDASTQAEQIMALEAELAAVGNDPARTPPGLHAHLGMLYAEVGRTEDALAGFSTEKSLFPESAAFMDFLISNLLKVAE